jgi:large subunit ribosomal protein L10
MAIPLHRNYPKQLVADYLACKWGEPVKWALQMHIKELILSLNRSEKQAVIDEVNGLAAKAQTLVIAEYRGITVADMTKLRSSARSNGVSLSVLKNTLARRAVAGSAFDVVADQMTGPLIYGFSVDAVAAAKVVADFAKTNDKLVIRAGAFAGKALDVNGVKQLANIPSKEVLLAQLVGLLQSPISRTARVLSAVAGTKGEAVAA